MTLKVTGRIVGGVGSVIVSFRSLFSLDTFGTGGGAERERERENISKCGFHYCGSKHLGDVMTDDTSIGIS